MNVLNAEQCVVFGDTFASCWGTSLDLTNTKGDSKVGNDGIFSLTTAMGDHNTPAVGLGELSTVNGHQKN